MIDYRPPQTEPTIIYCDDDLLVVDKPAELLSVPGRRPEHQDCLLSRIQQVYPEALIVHRLDMSTSGLMVLARSSAIQKQLSRQFEQRQVQKRYLAVVSGQLIIESGEIDLPLICDWPNRPRQMVDHTQGKTAHTHYKVARFDATAKTSRVELQPTTGRTHQLRVHLQAIGHPIIGDDLYADAETLNRSKRLLLHATELGFNHPTSGHPLYFTREAPF